MNATTSILKTWKIIEGIEVRLVENDAWNLCTADSEWHYSVVTASGGVETDEELFDSLDDAAREARIRANVLAEDVDD